MIHKMPHRGIKLADNLLISVSVCSFVVDSDKVDEFGHVKRLLKLHLTIIFTLSLSLELGQSGVKQHSIDQRQERRVV